MGKTLTKADVFDVASDLIEANGSTTTLDIKKECRDRGFFALQADVSDLMQQVCNEENWNFSYNGVHRVYTNKPAPAQTSVTASSGLRAAAAKTRPVQSTPVTTATGPSHTTRSGRVITSYQDKSEAKSGDWKAYSVIDGAELYFPGVYTRDDVRLAYKALLKIDVIADTRACRI